MIAVRSYVAPVK